MEKRSSLRDSGLNSLFRATVARETQGTEASSSEAAASPEISRVDDPGMDVGRRRLIQPSRSFPAVIRVVGVGGAGTNAVNRMLEAGLEGVEFIAINTDAQALQMCEADHKLRIGRDITRGLSSGSDPEIGREAALQAYDEIKALLKGSDMVFVTAGEGGGTGTGAAPVVAEIAKEVGALTIGVVSRPFGFEGRRRQATATSGIAELREKADTVIVVPNDKLLEVVPKGTTMLAALKVADDVLRQGIQGICDLVTTPGLINLDLADVRTIMTNAGTAHMGIGEARGENRAQRAAEMAINSSLLETSIAGAKGILLNVSGGDDLSLFEVNEVAQAITEAADPEANIIFGAVVDPSLGDLLRVTAVAAGFAAVPVAAGEAREKEEPAQAATADEEAAAAVAGGKVAGTSGESADIEPEIPDFVTKESTGGKDDLELPPFLRH